MFRTRRVESYLAQHDAAWDTSATWFQHVGTCCGHIGPYWSYGHMYDNAGHIGQIVPYWTTHVPLSCHMVPYLGLPWPLPVFSCHLI